MSSAPLRRRKRNIYETLKTARKGFRCFKIASSRCLGGALIRKTAMGQQIGRELAGRDAGLDAQPVGAKYLVLQREEVGFLFHLGGGILGQIYRYAGILRMKLILQKAHVQKIGRRKIDLPLAERVPAPHLVPIGPFWKIGANVEAQVGVGRGIKPCAPFPNRPLESQSRRPAIESQTAGELN